MRRLVRRFFDMREFSERNPFVIGSIGVGVVVVVVLILLNYGKLTFITGQKEYSAYFAEAGGLATNDPVSVSGAGIGRVDSIALDGSRVLVKFRVPGDVRLGDRTEAAIKVRTFLGSKRLEVTPRGQGRLTGPIPLDRTRPAYQLPDALGDLSNTVNGLNTDQLSNALSVLAKEFAGTPAELKPAVQGAARISQALNERDKELRNLLSNANKVTKVLAERTDEVVDLIAHTNSLLAQLKTESGAIDHLANDVANIVRQLAGITGDNRATLKPALDKLNGVLAILDNRKERVQKAIKGINDFAGGLGDAVASGPFFKGYIANLLPGQFIQPFIDAAFSDLGLDPATQLPSQLTDPQTGQPATPPLPMPYPRTGQGGQPRLNIPDAITGNPGDQPCSVPGRPGVPGCYPHREEPPAPPPGGPPPGPPAPGPGPGTAPSWPVEEPAPGQIPPVQPPVLRGPGALRPPPGPTQPGEGGRQ